MDIVFIGSGRFGLPSLEALKEAGHKILRVVTQPDRKKGRGMHLAETTIKLYAKKCGIKVYDPQEINAQESENYLKRLNADLFVVISYGQILKEEILNIPKIFVLNVHASLLPKYRGAAPINWAIANGETKTGITIIKMSPQMDAGPILLQESLAITPVDDALTLEAKLGQLSALLLPRAIERIVNNSHSLKDQDGSCVSYAPKLKKEQGLIAWNRPAQEIYNLIRGFVEWPGAFIGYRGKLIKVHKASVSPEVSPQTLLKAPGRIISVSQQGILVAATQGNLLIEELQPPGKRRMTVKEFIAGHRVKPGESFEKA